MVLFSIAPAAFRLSWLPLLYFIALSLWMSQIRFWIRILKLSNFILFGERHTDIDTHTMRNGMEENKQKPTWSNWTSLHSYSQITSPSLSTITVGRNSQQTPIWRLLAEVFESKWRFQLHGNIPKPKAEQWNKTSLNNKTFYPGLHRNSPTLIKSSRQNLWASSLPNWDVTTHATASFSNHREAAVPHSHGSHEEEDLWKRSSFSEDTETSPGASQPRGKSAKSRDLSSV